MGSLKRKERLTNHLFLLLTCMLAFNKRLARLLSTYKAGDVYIHKQLGYRGIILYPFTAKSTIKSEPEIDVQMYASLLLNAEVPNVPTRQTTHRIRNSIEKHLLLGMVRLDNDLKHQREEGEHILSPVDDSNMSAKVENGYIPISGFDTVSQENIEIDGNEVNQADKVPSLIPYFFNAQTLAPQMRFISQWKDAYDLSEFAHCISKDFEDVKTELFTYHIATDETGLNSMFRYRVNICLNELSVKDQQAHLTAGPIIWKLKGAAQADQQYSNYIFFTRSDYHDPIELNSKRKSVQFNGNLMLPNKLKFFNVTAIIICRWSGKDLSNESRTFEMPSFQIKLE